MITQPLNTCILTVAIKIIIKFIFNKSLTLTSTSLPRLVKSNKVYHTNSSDVTLISLLYTKKFAV